FRRVLFRAVTSPLGKLMYAPSESVVEGRLIVNATDTQRSTSTARMNIPRIEAPLVIFWMIPPDKSLVMLEPARYPISCVYHRKAIRMMFQPRKKMIGPMML